jgi:hypothetical protein
MRLEKGTVFRIRLVRRHRNNKSFAFRGFGIIITDVNFFQVAESQFPIRI